MVRCLLGGQRLEAIAKEAAGSAASCAARLWARSMAHWKRHLMGNGSRWLNSACFACECFVRYGRGCTSGLVAGATPCNPRSSVALEQVLYQNSTANYMALVRPRGLQQACGPNEDSSTTQWAGWDSEQHAATTETEVGGLDRDASLHIGVVLACRRINGLNLAKPG